MLAKHFCVLSTTESMATIWQVGYISSPIPRGLSCYPFKSGDSVVGSGFYLLPNVYRLARVCVNPCFIA